MDELERLYETRLGPRAAERQILWATLVEAYFQRFVGPTDTVLDLGAGNCEFINAIAAADRIAVDRRPDVADRAAPGVRVCRARSTDLPADLTGHVDVVWISNFLEHLADSQELMATLAEVHRVLRPAGRVMILQPNIRLTREAYWDFLDHSLPLTEKSLGEALGLTGFSIELQRVRFLPYTTVSRIPIRPSLVRLYLKVRPAQLVMGKQTFVVARRD